ncbi:Hypothetical protein LUCI_3881 [Lucifera butyrica]|uniref:Lysine-N-methylase n=1 Tax=Lucifera butyrica TaxID=1351585 RepID=A0A498RET9_9FIRM|nr:flagellin lysine-N-methylase [Lucifera butyrica]VBB08603.1 Hypothetical protein LUCI_3881 [Lucifera butyrica]
MLSFEKTFEPQYFQSFHCSVGNCLDSCCTGWDIAIDKETYVAYQNCQEPLLKPLFQENLVINDKSVANSTYVPYALVKTNQYICPFLTSRKLCIIQKTLDETALSMTCATYPRTFNVVNGVLERSLNLSCPEAARLALLNEDPMQFESYEFVVGVRNPEVPLLNTQSSAQNKPYQYFYAIRDFIVALLQDRTYPLWQRLIILSVFCGRLEQVIAENYETDIPCLLSYFNAKIREGEFRAAMSEAETNLEMQIQVVKVLLDHRLRVGFVSNRFLACINEFKQGLGIGEAAPDEDAVARYAEAYSKYYQPLLERHEYILENYIVNYVFKNLFPFGPQKNSFFEPQSIYDEYILLALHYSLIKSLLIGTAAYYQTDFGTEQAVNLIQIFAKTIEHNRPYLEQAVQFIHACNMNNTGGMNVLLKN